MFTGLVQCMGNVTGSDINNRDLRLNVEATLLAPKVINIGDSVSVNGVCLTVVENSHYRLRFDVSAETISVSTLGRLVVGSRVNLELALTASDRMGGHFVSGHVDGIGKLAARATVGESESMTFLAPAELQRYIAKKGSICVDGVSLTVNTLTDNGFTVNIVPYTQRTTILGQLCEGQSVNLEVDIIARYLERLMTYSPQPTKPAKAEAMGEDDTQSITKQYLAEHGFLTPDMDDNGPTTDHDV